MNKKFIKNTNILILITYLSYLAVLGFHHHSINIQFNHSISQIETEHHHNHDINILQDSCQLCHLSYNSFYFASYFNKSIETAIVGQQLKLYDYNFLPVYQFTSFINRGPPAVLSI